MNFLKSFFTFQGINVLIGSSEKIAYKEKNQLIGVPFFFFIINLQFQINDNLNFIYLISSGCIKEYNNQDNYEKLNYLGALVGWR